MRVVSVAIENFKLLHKIELKIDDVNTNVVFLNARNGRGKTSFQSALKWCFYAEQLDESVVSKHEIAESRIGEFIRVLVEVVFQEDDRKISVKRLQNFEKVNDFEARPSGQSEIVIKISEPNSSQPTELVPNPNSWLEENLPSRLMNFFLFDGELMYQFFDPKVRGAIDKAIKEIARVDLFEGIAGKFRKVESTARNQIARLAGGDAPKLLAELEKQQKLARILQKDLAENEEKTLAKQSEVQGIANRLAGQEHLHEYLDEQRALRVQLETLISERLEKQHEFQAKVLKFGVQSVFVTLFPGFDEQVNLAKENDRLPPPFEPDQLNLLIEREVCICGCDIGAKSEGAKQIKELISRYAESSEIGKELQQINSDVQVVRAQVATGAQLLDSLNSEIMRIENSIGLAKDRLNQIFTIIGEDDDQDLSDLARRQKIAMSDIEDLVRDRQDIERQVTKVDAAVSSALIKYDKAVTGAGAIDALSRKAIAADLLANSAMKMHDDAIEIVRGELEKTINANFDFVKDGYFTTEINDDFEVITRDKNGQIAALSEGEKMLKAYLFAFALRGVVGLMFPLIVDTPFGRLDEQYRLDTAKALSNLIEKMDADSTVQSIFLMHDAEYTPYAKRVFDQLDSVEFYLQLESPEKSILGQGIAPEWTQIEMGAWRDWFEGKI